MIKKKGAIFDMDGTLLDSMWVWRQIDVDFLGRRGFEVPSDYLEMITPMGYYRAAEYTIERFGLNEKPEDLIQEWHGMAAEAYAKKVELKSHAKEYLLKLKKDLVYRLRKVIFLLQSSPGYPRRHLRFP